MRDMQEELRADRGALSEDVIEHDISLLDLVYDAVFEREFYGDRIRLWNRSAEVLYGWSRGEAIGRSSHELLHTEFPEPFETIRDRLIREGHWEGELLHTARDGRSIAVGSRWAVRRENGQPVAILEINWDITEQKRAEEERSRLAAIVRSSQDAIIGKTLDAIITSWNPAAERLYGYSAEEVIGKPISILVPPEMPDELPNIMRHIRRGEPIEQYETIRVRKDGRRLNISLSISPIRNAEGTIVGAATIARDITQRIRAEEERTRLLERERAAREDAEWAERRLAFLAEASAVLAGSLDYETTLGNVARLAVPHVADWCAINIVDEPGTVRRLAVTHVDPAKIALAEELERTYPPDPDVPTGASRVLSTGESVLVEEITDEMIVAGAQDEEHLRLIRQLGLTSIMLVALRGRERILGVITFATAESGRHYDRDDLALAEDLARRAAVAVENARLYQDVQDALRLREEFLSIASHELKTPLTALQLQAQLLRRLLKKEGQTQIPAETGQRVLEGVDRQVQRLTRLTNDLLDVSRISSGRFDIERSEVDLSALVHEVVERFTPELAASGCLVHLDAPSPVVGQWDRHRLDQVVSNLLANAVKYGLGRPIDIAVEQQDGTARLTIKDQGIGIHSQHVATIFDRFVRVDTSERYAGLGLGLYIVRQILEAHGGSIRVESEPDVGSTFMVELPL